MNKYIYDDTAAESGANKAFEAFYKNDQDECTFTRDEFKSMQMKICDISNRRGRLRAIGCMILFGGAMLLYEWTQKKIAGHTWDL